MQGSNRRKVEHNGACVMVKGSSYPHVAAGLEPDGNRGVCVVAVPGYRPLQGRSRRVEMDCERQHQDHLLAANAVAMVAFAFLPPKANPVVLWMAIRSELGRNKISVSHIILGNVDMSRDEVPP